MSTIDITKTTVTVGNLISLLTKVIVENSGNSFKHPYEGSPNDAAVQAKIASDISHSLLNSMERASGGLIKGDLTDA